MLSAEVHHGSHEGANEDFNTMIDQIVAIEAGKKHSQLRQSVVERWRKFEGSEIELALSCKNFTELMRRADEIDMDTETDEFFALVEFVNKKPKPITKQQQVSEVRDEVEDLGIHEALVKKRQDREARQVSEVGGEVEDLGIHPALKRKRQSK